MKVRNRHLVRAAGVLGTAAARGLYRTLRFKLHVLGSEVRPLLNTTDRLIYCIWHENLLLPTLTFGCPEIAVLISRHTDGKLLGSLISALGMGMVEGSTNGGASRRGGIEAVRKLTQPNFPYRHLAITPDGPRGPRRVVQPGMVYVASRAGMRIVPVGAGYCNPWRAGSWDRFALPKPFTRACCVVADPIAVPPDAKAGELEAYRLRVQAEMDRLAGVAEGWAATGRLAAAAAHGGSPGKRRRMTRARFV